MNKGKIRNHYTNQAAQNESMNLSNLNLTNECSSLSPTSGGGVTGGTLTGPFAPAKLIKQSSNTTANNNLNSSLIVNKSLDLQ